ncbi:MAG: hypothetical protein AAF790_05920 [Planctomycetota bacterium]
MSLLLEDLEDGYAAIYNEASTIVQFAVHTQSPGDFDRLPATIAGVPLQMCADPESREGHLETWNDYCRYDHMIVSHKLGGYPQYENCRLDSLEAAWSALSGGYFHLLQLCAPGGFADDLPCGYYDWPFGYNTFHVFAKVIAQPPFVKFLYNWG